MNAIPTTPTRIYNSISEIFANLYANRCPIVAHPNKNKGTIPTYSVGIPICNPIGLKKSSRYGIFIINNVNIITDIRHGVFNAILTPVRINLRIGTDFAVAVGVVGRYGTAIRQIIEINIAATDAQVTQSYPINISNEPNADSAVPADSYVDFRPRMREYSRRFPYADTESYIRPSNATLRKPAWTPHRNIPTTNPVYVGNANHSKIAIIFRICPTIIDHRCPTRFVMYVIGAWPRIVPRADIINIVDNCRSLSPLACIKMAYTGVSNKNLLKNPNPYRDASSLFIILSFGRQYNRFFAKKYSKY